MRKWDDIYTEPMHDHPAEKDQMIAAMEAAGAVFLPAAGYRGGPVLAEENDLEGSNARGYYWSSAGGSITNAYDLQFSASNVSSGSGDYRSRRLSVRLVRELD